jgi:hypothetical protein
MSWIAPNNQVLNNVVGSVNGLGYNPVPTFDWNVLILVCHPFTPWIATDIIECRPTCRSCFQHHQRHHRYDLDRIHGHGYLLLQLLAHWLPAYQLVSSFLLRSGQWLISSNRTFDRFGKAYNILNITDSRGIFDQEKYEAYSPAYMSAGNITVYFWFFAAYAAVVSYAYLYHRREM